MLTSIGDLSRRERHVLMEQCLRLAASSDCTRMNFGAAVVKRRFWDGGASSDLVVIGQGYNRKASHCTSFVDCCNLRKRLGIPARMRGELCEAVHAGTAAIIDAVERGYQIRGAELVECGKRPTGEPYVKKWRNYSCTPCARLMHAFGIARVWVPVYAGEWLTASTVRLLGEEAFPAIDLVSLTTEEALTTSFEVAMGIRDLETGVQKEEGDARP